MALACLEAVQRVAALIFLLHAVDEQGDQEGEKESAYNPAHDHSCGEEGKGQGHRKGKTCLEPKEKGRGPLQSRSKSWKGLGISNLRRELE